MSVEEVNIAQVEDTQIIYQQDRATIDTMVATAKAYPRNIKRSTENAIAIVSMDRETASTCTYALPRGGKPITGPSVHLAKILAQTWGNMRVEAKVISIEDKHVTSQSIAFDLENNLAVKVEVKRSIMTKTGRMNDDMITVTGNAANAIALRNAVLSVVPRAIVDKVYKAAMGTITGDISDSDKLIKQRKKVIDALKDAYNVTEAEILTAIGKASMDHIGSDEIVVLIGIGQAIKDGDTTIEAAFRSKKETPNVDKSSKEKEHARIVEFISNSETLEQLESVKDLCDNPDLIDIYNFKKEELNGKK